jgi:hypothetical protein
VPPAEISGGTSVPESMENDLDMSLEVEGIPKDKGKGKAVDKAGNFQLDSFFG